jgi:hypothetical protein
MRAVVHAHSQQALARGRLQVKAQGPLMAFVFGAALSLKTFLLKMGIR